MENDYLGYTNIAISSDCYCRMRFNLNDRLFRFACGYFCIIIPTSHYLGLRAVSISTRLMMKHAVAIATETVIFRP